MVLSEASPLGEFGTIGVATTNNLLFINAPTGFEFNPGTGSVSHSAAGNIIFSSVLFVTASTIAISYNVDNNMTLRTDVLTISGIQVKALSVSATTDNATVGAGSTTIVGVTNGSTVAASFQSAITAIGFTSLTKCTNDGLVALSGSHTLSAGVSLNSTSFSGSNVSGTDFNTTAAGAGTHTVSYNVMTTGPTCTFTTSGTIDVNQAPTVTITATESGGTTDNDNVICTGTPVTFSANGASTYQFKVNGSNGAGASTVSPYTISSLANGNTVTVEGTSNGCTVTSSTVTVTVNGLPGSVTFNPSRTSFAETEDGFRLDTMDSPSPFAANPWNANSYFTGVGVVEGTGTNTGYDYFYPSVAGSGYNDVITYHYVDVNGCEATASSSFTVSGTTSAAFGGLSSSYCIYAASSTIYVPHSRISLYSGCGFWFCIANFTFDHFEYYNPTTAGWVTLASTYNAGQDRDEATFNPAVIGAYANGGTGLRDLRAVYTYGGDLLYTTAQTTINPRPTFYITNTWNYEYPCESWADSVLTFSSTTGISVNSYSSNPAGFMDYDGSDYLLNWGAARYYPYNGGNPVNSYTFNIQDVATACQNTLTFTRGVTYTPTTPSITAVSDKCAGDNVLNIAAGVTISQFGYVQTSWFRKDNAVNTNVDNNIVYGTVDAASTDYYSPGIMNVSDTFYVQQYSFPSCKSALSAPIIVKVNTPPTVDAGTYGNVCSSNPVVTLAGTRNPGGLGITWSKPVGVTGTFSGSPDINAPNPTYTAGTSEVTSGKIKLYLTTDDPDGAGIGCSAVKDSTEITINQEALISAGTPVTYCSNNTVFLAGSIGGSTSSITWYKSSVGGSQVGISDPTSLVTTYSLAPAEKSGGILTFVIESNDPDGGAGPCPKVNSLVNLTISPEPVVNAGTSIYSCGSANVPLNGTCTKIGGADLNATWKKGTWSDYITTTGAAKVSSYTPSGSEALGGTFAYWLVSDDPDGAGGPCLADSSYVMHTINQGAFVDAGAPSTWCTNTTPSLSAILSGSANAITWTKSGGLGIITSPNAVNTSYLVNAGDYASGTPLDIDFTATTNDPDGTDPLTGPCPAATDVVTITLNPHLTVSAGNSLEVCANQTINLNGTVKIGGIDRTTAGVNTWKTYGGGSGTFTLIGPSNLTGTYNPSGVITSSGVVVPGTGELGEGGTVFAYLISDDPDGPTGPCLADSQSIKIVINPLPIPHFAPTTLVEYCTNGAVVKLQGNLGSLSSTSGASATFSGGTYVTAAGFEYEFDPKKTYVLNNGGGQYNLRYSYEDNNTCENYVDTLVDVYPAPSVSFTTSTRCQGDTITFTEQATLNTSVYPGTENDWDWYIDGDTIQNTLPPTVYSLNTPTTEYSFANYGIHNIKLLVTTHSGTGTLNCSAKKDTNLVFGPYPNIGYTWSRSCSVDSVVFVNTTTIPTGYTNNQTWSMNGAGTYKNATSATSIHPRYKFAQPGLYNVTLSATTQGYNCTSSITQEVFVVPTYAITSTAPYDSTFHASNLNWAPSGTNYSWEWGTPAGKSVINTADNIWVTNLNGNYNIGELSYLNSPCFNFQNLDKPMVALRLWASTRNLAGAMMEVTTGYGQPWQTLGQIGDGMNWYNTSGVVGLIGASSTNPTAQGFSGENTDWSLSRLGLSQYANEDSLVRFRIVFGSHNANDALNQRDGIALDSIWIGNRSKVVMVEHFTNATAGVSAINANTAIDNMLLARPKDMAVVAFHTSTPSPDPYSIFNFNDPGARALYYGLADVPKSVVDGTYYNGSTYSGGTAQTRLDVADIDARALETARFNIDLNSNIASGQVNVGMKATYALTDSLFNNIVMHIVVVEDSASGNNSMNAVVRKMLPDAAGTVIARRWGKDMEVTTYSAWSHTLPATAKLGVVAYIQDHVTREIYQAAFVKGTGTSGSGIVDGTLDVNLSEWNIQLYPNPAQDEAMVLFGGGANQKINWQLIDAVGKVVDQGNSSVGSEGFVLNTSLQSAGIYTLKLTDEHGAVNAKKLVVVK